VTEAELVLGHAAVPEESPFGIPSRKLVMWLFILADAATFGAILFGYGYLRFGSADWTRPFDFFPSILNGIVMTAVLLTSSLTMLAAVGAAQTNRQASAIKWMIATTALGAVFAVLHLREWFSMFGEGWSPAHNPLGGSTLVGATFFSITGLHLLHVVGGVVAIPLVAAAYRRGRFGAGHVETVGLYWHFVDLVWMFVFPLVYLLNAR
jgi:cytochrome c oxidase subunit III